jgi:hypothetical protein
MRRLLTVALAALLLVGAAPAADWANIRPGVAVQNDVRKQFGQPTRVTSQKLDGYDTTTWRYEGEQAPRGMIKVTIDFGLLTPQGYKADVVRSMLLEPRPGIFNRATILSGWGTPDAVEKEGTTEVFKYLGGLFVYFDKEGWLAERLFFVHMAPPAPPAKT